jgi:hypothetical protein
LLGNSFLAAVAGTGSSCTTNSVSVGITATPPGCGCTPNRAAPCTFDGSKKQADLSCFICDANDLAAGECPACNVCLGNSNNCANTSITVVKFESCLASISTDDRMIARAAAQSGSSFLFKSRVYYKLIEISSIPIVAILTYFLRVSFNFIKLGSVYYLLSMKFVSSYFLLGNISLLASRWTMAYEYLLLFKSSLIGKSCSFVLVAQNICR